MYEQPKNIIKKIKNSTGELVYFLNQLYPKFVISNINGSLKNVIPIFAFHSITIESFRNQLNYLKQNKYDTITCQTLYKAIMGEINLPDRSVLLTFDDGFESVWSIAYPLLKSFDYKATTFVIPKYIEDENTIHPTLDDINNQKDGFDILKKRKEEKPFLTWGEINKMHKEGVIEVESHTYQHKRHFVDHKCINFYNPELAKWLFSFDRPVVLTKENDNLLQAEAWGAPLFRSNSRMSAELRYFDSEDIRLKCINFVQNQGGKQFFQEKNWKKILKKYYVQVIHPNGRFETQKEMSNQIFAELQLSKTAIEKNVDNKTVEHLCFPWGIGSDLASNISRKVGYKSNLWLVKKGHKENKVGIDPYSITRLKDDYIFRLPGEGRVSLSEIFKNKLQRRVLYHNIY